MEEILEELKSIKIMLEAIQKTQAIQQEQFGSLASDNTALQKRLVALQYPLHLRHDMTEKALSLAAKVFGIAELRENILLQLSFDDLVNAQRINKATLCAMKKSHAVQKRLHLMPDDHMYPYEFLEGMSGWDRPTTLGIVNTASQYRSGRYRLT